MRRKIGKERRDTTTHEAWKPNPEVKVAQYVIANSRFKKSETSLQDQSKLNELYRKCKSDYCLGVIMWRAPLRSQSSTEVFKIFMHSHKEASQDPCGRLLPLPRAQHSIGGRIRAKVERI